MSKIDDLRKKMAELAEELAKEEANSKANAFSKIEKLVEEASITPEELLEYFGLASKTSKKTSAGAKVSRASPQPKYRLPTGETWTGRGRPSKPIQAMLDKGHKLEEFLIK